jgi:UDP-glucose 4-epimerase
VAGHSPSVAVVTGGAGFIGSHMVDLLLGEGLEVRVLDNLSGGRLDNLSHHRGTSKLKVEVGDIRNIAIDAAVFKGAHYIFHFAGIGDIVPSIERPSEYMEVNVQGTVRMAEAARNAGVRKMVYAASSSCYGLASELPTTEHASIDTRYPYALSKYQGEQVTLHWNQVYGLPANSIRIFNAYGIRSRTSGAYGAVFGVFLAQKLAGKPFTVVGDGSQTRDFLYASDIARAFWLAALSEHSGRIYNLGAGAPQSVNRLAELLQGTVVHVPKRPGEPDCTWADISKIRRELNWEPKVSLEDGVGRMLKVIDYWKQAPVWDTSSIQEATRTWFAFMKN